MPDDSLGTAMVDYLRGDYDGSCVHCDPETGETWDANVESFYFAPYAEWSEPTQSLVDGLRTPVLDVGCGAGAHALVVQERGSVAAFDASPKAIRAARERGVENAFVADMFRMPVASDRFETAFVHGTQTALAASRTQLVSFLDALARVTTETGEAVVDSYDPADAGRSHGHRPTDEDGIGRRVFRVEYRGRGLVGPKLDFRTFSPDELRAACAETTWTVEEVTYGGDDGYYRARLQK